MSHYCDKLFILNKKYYKAIAIGLAGHSFEPAAV